MIVKSAPEMKTGIIVPSEPIKRENEAEIAFLRRLVQDQQNTIMALVVKKENND